MKRLKQVILVAVLCSAVSASVYFMVTPVTLWLEFLGKEISQFLVSSGLVVDKVIISNNRVVKKADILEIIDRKKTIVLLPLDNIKDDIMRLSGWVKNVTVKRILPDALHIDIEEYEPFANWRDGVEKAVIDNNGHIIIDQTIPGLINIAGNNALEDIGFVRSVMALSDHLSQRALTFEYVGNRRWNITFDGGLTVKFPESSPLISWRYLADLYNEAPDCLTWQTIDLRMTDKVYIQR